MAKKRLGKKILSQILAASMVFSLWGAPVNSLASEAPAAVEGAVEAGQATEETKVQEDLLQSAETLPIVDELEDPGAFSLITVPMPDTYTITPELDEGVSANVSATVVLEGGNCTVTFGARPGFRITSGSVYEGEEQRGLSDEELAKGTYTFENVQADCRIVLYTEPLTTVTFVVGENGHFVVDGKEVRETTNEDVMQRESLAVPEPIASAGYKFVEWRDTDENGAAVIPLQGLESNKTYYAVFAPKTITLTFKAETPGVAAFNGNGDSIVTATYTYDENVEIPSYPSVTIAPGYAEVGTNDGDSYWQTPEGARAVSGPVAESLPTEDQTYIFITNPASSRTYVVNFMNTNDELIAQVKGEIKLNEPIKVFNEETLETIEAQGYLVSEDLKGSVLGYTAANKIEMRSAEGSLMQESAKVENNNLVLDLKLLRVYEITTAGENVTISESAKAPAGSDYTVTFAANEGYGLSAVVVDGEALSQEEIQALNGSYTFTDLNSNHTISVAATHEPKLEIAVNVTSTPGADGVYKLGETITYTVTVTNAGNMRLQNVTAESILNHADGTSVVPDGQAEVFDLAIGETRTFTYSHVITAEDLGGTLTSQAAVTGSAVPVPGEEADVLTIAAVADAVATEDPYNCAVNVTLNLVEAVSDNAYAVENAEFYVALFADAALTQRIGEVKILSYNRETSSAVVTFDGLQKGTYYVAETNAAGVVVTNGIVDGVEFQVYYGETGNQRVDIAENGQSAAFTFANAFLNTDPSRYDSAQLTITKQVKDSNGKDLKSDDVFYFGLFKDAAYTQPTDSGDSIVAIDMNGNSSASTTVEVFIAEGGETTLYLTEVTPDGRPVKNDASFEYMMTGNAAVTLNLTDRRTAELTLTNTLKEEEIETETEKETEEQKEDVQNDGQKNDDQKKGSLQKESVKTGDNTPIMMYLIMLVVAAVILGGLLVLSRRRRRQ